MSTAVSPPANAVAVLANTANNKRAITSSDKSETPTTAADFAAILAEQTTPAAKMTALISADSPNEEDSTAEKDLQDPLSHITTEIVAPTAPIILPPPAITLPIDNTDSFSTDNELKSLSAELNTLLDKRDIRENPLQGIALNEQIAANDNTFATPMQFGHASNAQLATQNISGSNPISTPLHSPQWSEDFSQKLVWMAKNDLQTAQLSINPPNMGPIEVTLTLGIENASAHFASPHAEVRAVLEAALPKLKEMLADSGIQLGQANVSAQSQGQFSEQQKPKERGSSSFSRTQRPFQTDNIINGVQALRSRQGIGLVDTFV